MSPPTIPPAYLDALVAAARNAGRDFYARPLAREEQVEALALYLAGYSAEVAGLVIAGELIPRHVAAKATP